MTNKFEPFVQSDIGPYKAALAKAVEQITHQVDLHGVAMEVLEEASVAQYDKWGVQHHRDGTGKGYGNDVLADIKRFRESVTEPPADAARRRADHYASINGGDALEWEQILTEEVFEAYEEEDPEKLATELIQAAAVILSWVVDVRSREVKNDDV